VMIGAALLGIVVVALAVLAFCWARRGGRAQDVSVDSAQVEREVYEHLYGDSSAAVSRADRTDPRADRAAGTRVTGRALGGPMPQTKAGQSLRPASPGT
jgi:hypothetical protein